MPWFSEQAWNHISTQRLWELITEIPGPGETACCELLDTDFGNLMGFVRVWYIYPVPEFFLAWEQICFWNLEKFQQAALSHCGCRRRLPSLCTPHWVHFIRVALPAAGSAALVLCRGYGKSPVPSLLSLCPYPLLHPAIRFECPLKTPADIWQPCD